VVFGVWHKSGGRNANNNNFQKKTFLSSQRHHQLSFGAVVDSIQAFLIFSRCIAHI
jgi:hypothetical protein